LQLFAIVNSVITRYLTLAKVGRSTFAIQFCSYAITFSSLSLFAASSFFVIYLLLFIILPFVSNSYSIILLTYFAFGSAINIIHKTCTCFYLSIGSKSLLLSVWVEEGEIGTCVFSHDSAQSTVQCIENT
jgi:Cu/Ag efflux pump CusA